MPAPNFAGYMRAAILAHNPIGLNTWDEPTLRGVFNLLPTPSIPFGMWCERMSVPVFSQPEYLEANNRFIDFAHEHPELMHLENTNATH